MHTIKTARNWFSAQFRALDKDEAGQLAVENIAIIGLAAIVMMFGFKGLFGNGKADGLAAGGQSQGLLGSFLGGSMGGLGSIASSVGSLVGL